MDWEGLKKNDKGWNRLKTIETAWKGTNNDKGGIEKRIEKDWQGKQMEKV